MIPRVIVIGSSLGGPQALKLLLATLGRAADDLPILVSQRIPAPLTSWLAASLAQITAHNVLEGQDGEYVQCGNLYIAPGDKNMVIINHEDRAMIRVTDSLVPGVLQSVAQQTHRKFELRGEIGQAVDVLFQSVANFYGKEALGVVLAGAGQDGLVGASAIRKAGGIIIAQDCATSTMWGMPGDIAKSTIDCEMLPLELIGIRMAQILSNAN